MDNFHYEKLQITVLQMLPRTAHIRQCTGNSLQNIAIISHPTTGNDVQLTWLIAIDPNNSSVSPADDPITRHKEPLGLFTELRYHYMRLGAIINS